MKDKMIASKPKYKYDKERGVWVFTLGEVQTKLLKEESLPFFVPLKYKIILPKNLK